MARVLGEALRATGKALDRVGCQLLGKQSPLVEKFALRHRTIMAYGTTYPALSTSTFVAPNATVIGDVVIGKGSSIWYGAVLRGDVNDIRVGDHTSIGARAMVHVSAHHPKGLSAGTRIGNHCTVGEGAILHACTLKDGSVVEQGAIVFDGAVIESGGILGGGAVLPADKKVPSGELWAGNPAKKVRNLTVDEKEAIMPYAQELEKLGAKHKAEHVKSAEQKGLERDIANGVFENPDYIAKQVAGLNG